MWITLPEVKLIGIMVLLEKVPCKSGDNLHDCIHVAQTPQHTPQLPAHAFSGGCSAGAATGRQDDARLGNRRKTAFGLFGP